MGTLPGRAFMLLSLTSAAVAQELPARTFPASNAPSSLAAGDMDGDGLEDLVSGGYDLAVLRRAPEGGFLPPIGYPAAFATAAEVHLGHLDADGDLDVVYAQPSDISTPSISVRLGNGRGGLGAEFMQLLHDSPDDVALGDLDGDGDDDVAMASRYQNLVDVLYSDGAGGLKVPSPQSSLTTGDTPTDVVVGDLDGDGQLDLATVNIVSSTVTGWLGNGVSGFTPLPAPLPEPLNGSGLLVGDVDEDGNVDLVTGGPQLALFLGLGGATFAPYQTLGATGDLVALADMDGNGFGDLALINGGLTLLPGGPGAAFGTGAPPVALGSDPSEGVALLDVDGDGWRDAVIGSQDGQRVTVLTGIGFGELQSYERVHLDLPPTAFVATDLDGDSDVDVAVASYSGLTAVGGTSVLLNDGAGQLTLAGQWQLGTVLDITAGDVDGDGDRDLVSVLSEVGLQVQLGLGGGAFASGFIVHLGPPHSPHPWAVEAGDLDGDGDDDVVAKYELVGSTGGSMAVLLASGAGTFTAAPTVKAGASTAPPLLADVNGDTLLDLVASSDAQGAKTFPGLGTGAFAAAVITPLPSAAQQLEVGDVDVDGFLDLVVLHLVSAPGTITVLAGDGSGAFSPRQDLDAEVSPYGLALGDLDGDTYPELLSAGGAPAGITLRYDNDGTGTFLPATSYAAAYRPIDVSVVDLQGDGRMDVVVLNYISNFPDEGGELTVLRNLGPEEPWTWLGQGKAGAAGIPMLVGHGALLPGEPMSLELRGAKPQSAATLIIGLSPLFVPLKGGVLVPQPNFVFPGLGTDADGGIVLQANWPAGVPSGLQTWFQFWVADAGGYAASNGVTAVAP